MKLSLPTWFSIKMGVSKLKSKSDSQLVANQVARKYKDKEPQLIKYLHKVQSLSPSFTYFKVELQQGEREERKVRKQAVKYTLLIGKLYKMARASFMLQYLEEPKTTPVLSEVHKGACDSHICGMALSHKFLRVGYYWPTLLKDNIAFINSWDQCSRHTDLPHAPIELLCLMTPFWPFY